MCDHEQAFAKPTQRKSDTHNREVEGWLNLQMQLATKGVCILAETYLCHISDYYFGRTSKKLLIFELSAQRIIHPHKYLGTLKEIFNLISSE